MNEARAGAPGLRAVSYLPGRWAALVTEEFCLLGDLHLADPLLAACWVAGTAPDGGGVAAVLDVLARSGPDRAPSFVLVARAGDALRLVVAGRAHAEVFAGRQDPVVHGAGDVRTWFDERLDPALDVRLVADDTTPFERLAPLPLSSGIVLASYVFSTGGAPSAPSPSSATAHPGAAAGARPDEAVGWIPPPLAPQLSGVFRALPWRSSLVDPDEPSQVPQVPASPGSPAPGPSRNGDADAGTYTGTGTDIAAGPAPEPAGPPPVVEPRAGTDPVDKPLFGAPGYVPPPFGAEAFESDARQVEQYAYPPPPPPRPPPAAMPRPGAQADLATADAPAPPLVQAVRCVNGHANPLHTESCRVCGAGFAPQQPVTVERPSLGVLRLPTGEAIPLDRDVVLGRAPFAVDLRSVRLVEVASPDNDISRSHVRITPDGWQVFATDLGSTNGTAVALPGRPPALLRAHDPFALVPGAVLSLADEADVRFDAS